MPKIKKIIETFKDIKNQPDLIIDAGDLPKRKPSVIIDLAAKCLTRLR